MRKEDCALKETRLKPLRVIEQGNAMVCWKKFVSFLSTELGMREEEVEKELQRLEKELGHEYLSKLSKYELYRLVYRKKRAKIAQEAMTEAW